MLFTSVPPTYMKLAAARLLSSNPGSWHSELLAQLFEQHSYLGTYKVDLSVSGQNDEMGYIHGYFVIGQQTYPEPGQNQNTGMTMAQPVAQPTAQPQAQQSPPPGQAQPAAPAPTAAVPGVGLQQAQPMQPAAQPVGPSVRIPVIASKRKVFAFDVMIDADGAFQPLTESRIASLLIQPTLTQVTEASPDDQMFTSQFDPPADQRNSRGTTFEKEGHLLSAIAATVSDRVKEAFFSTLDCPEYRWVLENRPLFRNAVGTLYQTKVAAAVDLKTQVPPTTLVLEKTASGFTLYSANECAYAPDVLEVPKSEAGLLPQEMVQEALRVGISMASTPSPHQPDETDFELTKEAGIYAALRGNTMLEYTIVPEVFDINGHRQPTVLAVGPGTYSMQEKVAGAYLGPSEFDLGTPGGFGAFVSPDGLRALSPLTVLGASPLGFFAKTASVAKSVQLRKLADIRIPQRLSESVVAVPADWGFQPLGPESRVESEPSIVKTASGIEDYFHAVQMLDEGPGEVSFRGDPVDRLPAERREHVKLAEAVLLMGCLGLDGESVIEKLAACKSNGSSTFYAGRSVTDLETQRSHAKEKIASFIREFPIRPVDLLKEAAMLAHEDSVDTVLALGFITPENVQLYVDRLPELEQACRSMAELTIMARMGQPDIPETAASRAMSGLEKVIEGLKVLQLSLQAPEELSQQ